MLISSKIQPSLTSVITTCLLHEEHDNVHLAASELAFNVARYKVGMSLLTFLSSHLSLSQTCVIIVAMTITVAVFTKIITVVILHPCHNWPTTVNTNIYVVIISIIIIITTTIVIDCHHCRNNSVIIITSVSMVTIIIIVMVTITAIITSPLLLS